VKRLLLWIAALFVMALLVALGASVVAGGPDSATVARPDRSQPDALTSDLQISKVRYGSGTIMPGTTVTYSVRITNAGPSLAHDVRVTDTLPALVNYQSCTASQGSCGPAGGNVVQWYAGEQNAGESNTLTIIVQVASGASGQIANKAEVRSADFDSNTANNVVWLTLTVTQPASPTPTSTPRAPKRAFFPILMKQFVGGTTPTIIFSDNFDDGLLHGWTRNNGNWYVVGGYMHGDYATGNAWNIKDVSGSNFTYEGDVNILSGTSVGLTFRSSSDGRSSYNVMVDAVANTFKIVKQPGNAVLVSYSSSISRNHWYNVKVVVSGTKIEGYLEGVKRLTVYDTNFSSGQFGVMLTSATGAFDNLEARTLP